MKQIAKTFIPKSLEPMVRKMYRGLLGGAGADFSKADYQRLTALKCLISYNRYGGYCVPESSQHRPAAHKILLNEVYEAQTIQFMREHCGDGDIIHAGAYFGDFFPALSQACAPGAKIWTFEPNAENYRCAQITILINNIANIELANAGLGERCERLFIKTRDENGQALGGASQITAEGTGDALAEVEAVQIVTIDEVVPEDRKVSILQLDVEGHEQAALAGALQTIRRCRPILILEILPENDLLQSAWFAENIISLGYGLTGEVQRNSVYECAAIN